MSRRRELNMGQEPMLRLCSKECPSAADSHGRSEQFLFCFNLTVSRDLVAFTVWMLRLFCAVHLKI